MMQAVSNIVKYKNSPLFFLCCAVLFFYGCSNVGENKDNAGWQVYGGAKSRIQYASLDQIDTANVHRLQPAWAGNNYLKMPVWLPVTTAF